MLRLTDDYSDDSPINHVITVRECMNLFDIKQHKTVHMAIFTGRLIARKADDAIGKQGGNYLIDYDSAFAVWGNRRESDNG